MVGKGNKQSRSAYTSFSAIEDGLMWNVNYVETLSLGFWTWKVTNFLCSRLNAIAKHGAWCCSSRWLVDERNDHEKSCLSQQRALTAQQTIKATADAPSRGVFPKKREYNCYHLRWRNFTRRKSEVTHQEATDLPQQNHSFQLKALQTREMFHTSPVEKEVTITPRPDLIRSPSAIVQAK